MKIILLHLLLLLLLFAAPGSTAPSTTQRLIKVGNVELSLGMPKRVVLTTLKTKTNYLLTKLGETGWVASDKGTSHAVAILTFDDKGGLSRVQKNWTPVSDNSTAGEMPGYVVSRSVQEQRLSAMAFAQALYGLAEQMSEDESGRKLHACTLSASDRLVVGPDAWINHPGEPDLRIREVDVTCGQSTIEIYINLPTMGTRGQQAQSIQKVLLYESVAASAE